MALNLDNLTQLEIEEAFDQSMVKRDINEKIVAFAETIESNEPLIESIMSKYLFDIDIADVKEIVIILLSMLGNYKAGIVLGEDRNGNIKPLIKGMKKIHARDIPLIVFVKTFYKDRYIQETFKHKALDFAMDIVSELDTIFFDVVKRVEQVEDGQFRTFTYVRSELLFDVNTSLRAHYERFRLPLIEKPHRWTINKSGGYHLNKSRCITNRGNSNQPQNILDILNKLQEQPFTHGQDLDKEHSFNVAKFIKDGNSKSIAIKKADAMALTCNETYEAIGNREIYFEWKFDSRGRMYSTGYDINLQGNKAKKGALRPKLW